MLFAALTSAGGYRAAFGACAALSGITAVALLVRSRR
jgi:hypothetical protein